ncbi:MAG: hypothetical protein WDM71_05900 [Ferruginibacter sp.]
MQSGGANINFSDAGTLNISLDFNHISGTFNAGTGTVVYNGVENQDIANVTYNNLSINKASGIASVPDTVNILGNLLVLSGELDCFSPIAVSGNVTINSGTTLQDNSFMHVGGNWINNGTYEPFGSSIFFDGNSTQNISASPFNNLYINKPVGSKAVLMGNVMYMAT